MADYTMANAQLADRVAIFLDCCKEFGAFDIATVLNIDPWAAFKVCEALVETGMMTKIDNDPDDPDYDDIIYLPNNKILIGDVFKVLNTLDEEIFRELNPIRSEIMAFAVAMESKMKKHDPVKRDSWKTMDLEELEDMLNDTINAYELSPYSDYSEMVDIANFCMMLWNRVPAKE